MQLAPPLVGAQGVAPRLAQGCQARSTGPRFSRRWTPLPGSARGSIPRCACGRVPSWVSGCGWQFEWQHIPPAHYSKYSSAVNGSMLDLHHPSVSLKCSCCPEGVASLVIHRVSCLVRDHFSSLPSIVSVQLADLAVSHHPRQLCLNTCEATWSSKACSIRGLTPCCR